MWCLRHPALALLIVALPACAGPRDRGGPGPADAAVATDAGASAEMLAHLRAMARKREARARAEAMARAQAQRAIREAADAKAREEAAQAARQQAERAAFEATYPLHGVAYHFLAQIFAGPSNRSRVLGYMRRGAEFRAKKDGVHGPGCDAGWYEVPGGGFVCRGLGYKLGTTPQHFDPSPVPPALDDALPYAYAWTTHDDVPQYWRVPTPDEERQAAEVIAKMRAADARAATLADGGVPTPDGGTTDDEASTRTDDVEAPPPPGQHADTGLPTAAEQDGIDLPSFLRVRMSRGFYVSIDGEVTDGDRHFYRTVRGGIVPADALSPNEPPTMRGVVLGGSYELPVAFVYRSGNHRLRRVAASGLFHDEGAIDTGTPLVVADTLERHGRSYVVGRDGSIVRRSAVRIAQASERPDGVPEGARWIHVVLSEQTLVAYEGDTPVFATIVSSGKEGHDTPTGLFQIQSKHVTITMDDLGIARCGLQHRGRALDHVLRRELCAARRVLALGLRPRAQPRLREPGAGRCTLALPVDDAHAPRRLARHLRRRAAPGHLRLHRAMTGGRASAGRSGARGESKAFT